MKSYRKVCLLFLCICSLLIVLTPTARAFQVAIPGVTVIVGFPPGDLELSLRVQEGDAFTTVQPRKGQIAWETRYRFTYDRDPRAQPPVENAALVVSSGGKTFECPLSDLMRIIHSNDIYFLDVSRQTVTRGQSVGRAVSLASMRVLLTLLLEGLLFFAFRYWKKRSWIAFAIINLITQGALNVVMSLHFTNPYLFLFLIPMSVPLLIIELIAFVVIVNEHRRRRTIAYVVAANLLSLLLMLVVLIYLPV